MTDPNTSATGGFLLPTSPTPDVADDLALVAIFQPAVTAICAIAGDLVRPRWQLDPPPIPPAGTNWVALGIPTEDADANPYVGHTSANETYPNGADYLLRQEQLDILLSFYGPNAASNAALLRDGLNIAQNRDFLTAAGMSYVVASGRRNASSLINSRWISRIDMTITVRRVVVRVYPIEDILTENFTINTSR